MSEKKLTENLYKVFEQKKVSHLFYFEKTEQIT
jgi:hypothetical protein